jgi:predicted O-methyltransferase YrrM
MAETSIAGQLNEQERRILTAAVRDAAKKPDVVMEVGTWLGGGSTLHFLRALHENGQGHLWGIEADRGIYERMIQNIRDAAPEAAARFTPVFGRSQEAIPQWLSERGAKETVDLVFLDGGDNPLEQITEFKLLADRIPIGGRLLAHDAKLRKGKWLRPYLSLLDNWRVQLHDVSGEGLLEAVKLRGHPGAESLRAAEAKLFLLRLDPVEVAGSLLPRRICEIILGAMPAKLMRRVSQGRK